MIAHSATLASVICAMNHNNSPSTDTRGRFAPSDTATEIVPGPVVNGMVSG